MDNQKFMDSTYGSFSGFLSSNSNSSYTMSLSDSEFPEEPPSTSGCSSDFANSTSQKEKRKERLKQYLKQLKQIVAPEAIVGTQMSTIGALKHVINSFQKSKDVSKSETQDNQDESQKCISICTPLSSTSESDNETNILSLKAQDELQILVNTKGLKIIQVSPNLRKILGYPMDSWIGRELTSFLHRKDVVTVNSSYTYEDPEQYDSTFLKFDEEGNTAEPTKKMIYCRLRHYKGLKHGFNIEKKDQYSSFQAQVSTKTVMKVDEFNTEKQKQYILLECRPLTSAYKNWSDISVDKKTFSTRHSLFCSYTYIHPNAIPLLGFLPQDMVGMSIFDFYHPEDFEQLYNIYKQVVNSKGTTVSSPRIRFRTYSGEWIYVKTEWSSFINPWSKRLEFIIGQHTVIKGPNNPDVFSPPISQECIAEETEQCHKNLRLIRKLLLQPVVDEARTVALNIEDDPRDESVSPDDENLDSSERADDPKKKFPKSVPADLSCRQLLDANVSGTYEQLNYTNSIKRFLLSQPKTYSSSSDKRSGNESYTDESNAIDSDEVPDFEVDIPLPKPPSFCSSTKRMCVDEIVLVSEKEDMVPSPSCQTEEINDDSMKEAPAPTSEQPNVLMSLTEVTLQEHTKRQEKIYLEQAKQDSNLVLLNMTSRNSVLQESLSQGLKRGHSPDMDEIQNVKSFKGEEVSLLHPPFPITTVENKLQKKEVQQPNITFSNMYSLGMTPTTPLGMYHTETMPVVQLLPKNMTYLTSIDMPFSTTGPKPDNIQWPYYPQSGLQFYPQVMGGFYQPLTVLSHPTSVQASTVKGVKTTNPQGISTQACDKANTAMSLSDTTSSNDNTSSSLMYLLELSNNSEAEQARNKAKSKHLPVKLQTNRRDVEPPWLFGVLWRDSIQMRYTVPRRKFNRIMKEDRDALNLMKQSELVLQQMREFKEDIEKTEEPTEDEEADFLFIINPDYIKDDSSSDSRETDINRKLDNNFKFTVASGPDEAMSKSSIETSSGENVSLSFSATQDSLSVSDQMDEQEKKSDSDGDSVQKSADNDSSVDMESTYSKSSDLTPSDARSTDEKGSSMKESDSLSSKNSDANKDSESENDLNQTKSLSDQFDQFFIKNPTKFKTSKKGFWMGEVDFNPKLAMEFTVRKSKTSNDILVNDWQRLNEMNQSLIVHDQLSFLLEDLVPTSSERSIQCCCNSSTVKSKMDQGVKCLKCSEVKKKTKLTDNFFDSLFMPPLFPEQEGDDDRPRQSPDMADLCNIIDAVD